MLAATAVNSSHKMVNGDDAAASPRRRNTVGAALPAAAAPRCERLPGIATPTLFSSRQTTAIALYSCLGQREDVHHFDIPVEPPLC